MKNKILGALLMIPFIIFSIMIISTGILFAITAICIILNNKEFIAVMEAIIIVIGLLAFLPFISWLFDVGYSLYIKK
jgi:hypothetical protein